MNQNEFSDIAVEVLKERSKDIYDDGLKSATKEGGEALQAIVGLFNNVVLYPIKKANITYKYKLKQFEQELSEKIDKIAEDKFVEPPLTIVGPTIEALKYTFEASELREMYLNLLASSMNSDTIMLAHPSYVDIIKSMSSLDAIIFKRAFNLNDNIAVARVTIGFDNKIYTNAMPRIFAPGLLEGENPFLVSSSLENLCRLGVLTFNENTIMGFDYENFKSHAFVQNQLHQYTQVDLNRDLRLDVNGKVIYLSNFGRNFGNTCL